MSWCWAIFVAAVFSSAAWAGGAGPRPDAVTEATGGGGGRFAPVRGQSTSSVVTTTFPVVLDFTSDPEPVPISLDLPEPTSGNAFVSSKTDPAAPILLYLTYPGHNVQVTRSPADSSYTGSEAPPKLSLRWRCDQSGSYNAVILSVDVLTDVSGSNACSSSIEYYFEATTTSTTKAGFVHYLVALAEQDGSPAAFHGVYIDFPTSLSLNVTTSSAAVTADWDDSDGALVGAPGGIAWDAGMFHSGEVSGGVFQAYSNTVADVAVQVTDLTTSPPGGSYGATELYTWLEYCSTGGVLSSCAPGNVLYSPEIKLDLDKVEIGILVPNDLTLFPGVLNGEIRYFAKAPGDQVAGTFTATVTFTVLGAM